MKSLSNFIRSTIVGGIMFLVPEVVIVIVMARELGLIRRISEPMTRFVPVYSPGAPKPWSASIVWRAAGRIKPIVVNMIAPAAVYANRDLAATGYVRGSPNPA